MLSFYYINLKYYVKYNIIKIVIEQSVSTISNEPETKAQEKKKEELSSEVECIVEPVTVTDLSETVEGIIPTVVTLNTSSYCPCIECCGKTDGITASEALQYGRKNLECYVYEF